MRVELHCHSLRSDGALPPATVAERAAADGVAVFALTDHDTTSGYDETLVPLADREVFRALELSCHHAGRSVHLLVYDVARDERRWQALESRLEEIAEARRQRVHVIAAKLAALGAPIDADEVLRATRGATVGRPHVAAALVAAGHVRNKRDAFTRYLRDGGPADIPSSKLGLAEGTELAVAAGGRVALAHPHVYGAELAREILDLTMPSGLSGLEVHYAGYSAAESNRWYRMASELGLVATAGSDFHEDEPGGPAHFGVDLDRKSARALRDWLELD